MDSRSTLVSLFADCILTSIDAGEFRWELFFRKWYRENGKPLFFLFKKNLSVTNAQYSELFSLLSVHSRDILNSNESKLLFYVTDHIRTTFSEAIGNLLEGSYKQDNRKLLEFSERYIDVFGSTIAVDLFFSSCAVFLPPNIETDLERIVYDSGYLHSAGRSIYIRNIRKAKKNVLLANLEWHIQNQHHGDDKIPFVVYSHEDFSAYDKDFSEQIDRGIEQCKMYIEKMSMGIDRLSTIISGLADNFKEKLFVPKPGDYRMEHQFKKGKTIWLISDRSLSSGNLRNPGSARYYICYEQVLKNDSPFFFFDENKPAWKSHTTMPHSLTSALLNIARPLVPEAVICDPFGGTGTTWFEVKRMKIGSKVICSDLSPATSLLIQDNLRFFLMSSDELQALMKNIKACNPARLVDSQQTSMAFGDNGTHVDHYSKVIRLLADLRKEQPDEDQEFVLSTGFVEKLKQLPFLTRIIFFIGLRAELRFQSGFKRKSVTFETAFRKSQDALMEQIQIYINLKAEVEREIGINVGTEVATERDRLSPFLKTIATYSYKLTPSFVFEKQEEHVIGAADGVYSAKDARDLEPQSCDIILCDPPYGFNTTEDESSLANLYSEFLDRAIAAIKPYGQLIICLPSESFTGKELPFCTRSDLVSRQILTKAHRQKRIVYSPAKSLPSIFSPPYYWEADRALRRNILHFRFL